MFIPRFCRVDNGTPSHLTRTEIKPFVLEAMAEYHALLEDDYGEHLLSVEQAAEHTLREHNIVLINGEYLLGYSEGSEWYARGTVLTEEYLIRIAPGKTQLKEVVETFKALTLIHGARGCQLGTRASPNKEAIRRLYQRAGLTEVMSIMRS